MKIDIEFARRDDCLDQMVPSDLRLLVSERDQLRAELAAIKAGQGEAVGEIWAMADGKQYGSLFTEHMNSQKLVGARLYTAPPAPPAPPASSDAVLVPVELLERAIRCMGEKSNHQETHATKYATADELRALLAQSESKGVES